MEREEAERLVAQYGSAVYRLAYARTGSREDAEDVTQETFLRLVRSSPVFQDGAHEKAWLLRVAAHCAADVFRAPWRKRDLPLEAAAGASAPPPEEPDGGVLAAVLALPEKYRLPFTTRAILSRRRRPSWAGGRAPCGPSSPGPGPCCGRDWRRSAHDGTGIPAGDGPGGAVPGPARPHCPGHGGGAAPETAPAAPDAAAGGGGAGLRWTRTWKSGWCRR